LRFIRYVAPGGRSATFFEVKARASTYFAAASLAFVVVYGCGNQRPPPAGDGTTVNTGSGGGDVFADAGGTKPPGCGTAPDGTYCDCVDAPLFADAPNMYFVLDRSGSMAQDNKWMQVRVVVGKIMRSLGPRANFGAMIYPGNTQEDCSPGVEIMPTRPGDPPSSSVDGPTTQILLTRSNVVPGGGTPTSASLTEVLPIVQKLPGKTFVILATDGAPNCNDDVACGYDKCMPNIEDAPGCPKLGPFNCCAPPDGVRSNCLDAQGSVDAAAALKNAGVPVYVIGLPGSGVYADVLDSVAVAGGTAGQTSPKYFAVGAADETAMLTALKKVAAKIVATCEFNLKDEPPDPRLVNVYVDDVVLPYDPNATWKIEGKTVTLLGDTCNKVMNGDILDVRIISGCPRVEPR
jgi:hypothetical protein